MPKALTKEEYIKKLENENPTVELISDYNGNKKEITVRCKIDGYVWKTTPYRLHSGSGCQKCYDRRRGDSTRKPLEENIRQSQEKYKDENGEPLYDYSLIKEEDYKNTHQKLPMICKIHGVFHQSFMKHIFGNRGCPICGKLNRRNSILEDEIEKLLNENNIEFEKEKSFDWLKNKEKLYLDFYISFLDLAIECQGIQHFKSVNHFGGEEYFKVLQERDKIKYNLCKEHNINIIYIISDETNYRIKDFSNYFEKPIILNEENKQYIIKSIINNE